MLLAGELVAKIFLESLFSIALFPQFANILVGYSMTFTYFPGATLILNWISFFDLFYVILQKYLKQVVVFFANKYVSICFIVFEHSEILYRAY